MTTDEASPFGKEIEDAPFTMGSLFTGIFGLDLGLQRALGAELRWCAESDAYCRAVLANHYPGVRCYADVRDVTAGAEYVDLLCGGFPCQDLSVAGKGAALAATLRRPVRMAAAARRGSNPRFVAWLMGFGMGYLDAIDAIGSVRLAARSSRKSVK